MTKLSSRQPAAHNFLLNRGRNEKRYSHIQQSGELALWFFQHFLSAKEQNSDLLLEKSELLFCEERRDANRSHCSLKKGRRERFALGLKRANPSRCSFL